MFNSELTLEDFRKFDWQQIIEASEKKECGIYSTLFLEEAKRFEAEGDHTAANVCILMGLVTSFSPNFDNPKEPFRTEWATSIGVGEPQGITQQHWQILTVIVPEIRDAELRARVADVVSVLKVAKYDTVQQAIDAYLEIAKLLEDPVHWTEGFQRIERAFQLGRQLGRNHEYFTKVVEYTESTLSRLNGEDPLWFSSRLMSLLLDAGLGDPIKYAALANKNASNALLAYDWRRVRDYWEIEARWLGMANQLEDQQRIKLQIAESYVTEAKYYLGMKAPDYWKAVHELARSLEAMRRINAPKELIERVHKMLLEAGEKSTLMMREYSYSVDLSEFDTAAREAVKGRLLRDAILFLAGAFQPNSVEQLREQALEHQREFAFMSFVQRQQVDEKGRVTGVYPAMAFGSEDSKEKALRAEMYSQALLSHSCRAHATVRPMLYVINMEHYVRLQDFFEFVKDNPFIPQGREIIFARGLYLGLTGDFLTATHLLIPQIENSIRYQLYQRGAITTKYDDEGIQDVYPLGKLLYMEETKDIFSSDLLFELQGLLVERLGANLRNRVAHGLLHANIFDGDISVYFWWLTLYLCCYPALIKASDTASHTG